MVKTGTLGVLRGDSTGITLWEFVNTDIEAFEMFKIFTCPDVVSITLNI